jgi:hypothetical protein
MDKCRISSIIDPSGFFPSGTYVRTCNKTLLKFVPFGGSSTSHNTTSISKYMAIIKRLNMFLIQTIMLPFSQLQSFVMWSRLRASAVTEAFLPDYNMNA